MAIARSASMSGVNALEIRRGKVEGDLWKFTHVKVVERRCTVVMNANAGTSKVNMPSSSKAID